MNCREVSEFLRELVAGELPTEVQAEFDAHMAACHNCVEFLTQYRQTITVSQSVFQLPADVPEELVDAILKALRQARS